jgi:hypothetical protein
MSFFSNNSYYHLNENEQLHTLNSIVVDTRTFSIKDDGIIHHASVNLPFTSTIKLYIHPMKINDVLEISNLLNYDEETLLLSVNTNSIANNIALLYLAAKVNSGEISLKKIKNQDIVNKYLTGQGKKTGKHIKESLIRLILKNIVKQPQSKP